jgi:nucleoside-diphosphate-sugar epimerase
LASIRNRRSLIFLENLVDLIVLALARAEPATGAFLLRDDEEVATPELIRRLGRHLGRKPRLWPFPPALLRLGAAAAGKSGMADRLLGTLAIDDSQTRTTLNWKPRFGLDEGLAATCRWFRDRADAGPGRSPL